MARKKRTKIRYRTKRIKVRAKRRRGITSYGWLLGAISYGAIRQYVSEKIAPYTARIPLGEISDEVGMLGLSYLLYRGRIPFLKNSLLRDIGKAGMTIESARIGEYIAQKGFQLSSGTPKNTLLQVTLK